MQPSFVINKNFCDRPDISNIKLNGAKNCFDVDIAIKILFSPVNILYFAGCLMIDHSPPHHRLPPECDIIPDLRSVNSSGNSAAAMFPDGVSGEKAACVLEIISCWG